MDTSLMTVFRTALGLGLVLSTFPAWAEPQDPCAGFSWDLSQQRAVFATAASGLTAGKDATAAPTLLANRLYGVQLLPQASVSFAVPPSKKVPAESGYAGLASVQVSASGLYRVSADTAFWIDIIVAGKVLEPKDYQGQKGCGAPRKVVEFELPASVPILLEISSAVSPEVRVSITAAPPPKA
jgi:hypothetical protein